jgi:putative flavoprotein involved in K+ transport
VYLSIGRCQRWPRRYRGKDIWTWFDDMGLLDEVGRRHYIDPSYGCTAVLTGVRGGYDLDYDRFAAAGVTLVGHLQGYENGTLRIADDLQERLDRWDESRALLTGMIDDYIQQVGLDMPPDTVPDGAASRAWRRRAPLLEVDLAARGISTVLWATGFSHDFRWLKMPVLDERGDPVQWRGVTALPGIYFLGLRRMHTVKSSFLFGVGEDAAYLAEHIAAGT